MKELINFLNENRNGQFATIKDNMPVMRPFQFVFAKDEKFYFITSNVKDVYKQLKEAGVAGFAVMAKTGWARLYGKVEFIDSLELKEEALKDKLTRSVYKTADNPVMEMFYIHSGVANLYEYGKTPINIEI